MAGLSGIFDQIFGFIMGYDAQQNIDKFIETRNHNRVIAKNNPGVKARVTAINNMLLGTFDAQNRFVTVFVDNVKPFYSGGKVYLNNCGIYSGQHQVQYIYHPEPRPFPSAEWIKYIEKHDNAGKGVLYLPFTQQIAESITLNDNVSLFEGTNNSTASNPEFPTPPGKVVDNIFEYLKNLPVKFNQLEPKYKYASAGALLLLIIIMLTKNE